MLRIRIFFMNSTTHKRRHTYSNQLEIVSRPVIEASENPFAGRHSEIINRASDPIYNYYMSASCGGGGTTSNKTKKNRRVI
jgi:hypothetical protein